MKYLKNIFLLLHFLLIINGLEAQSKNDSIPQKDYGKNIINLNPLEAMDIGFGGGLTYERIISKDKKVALVFPFSVIYQDNSYTEVYGANYYFTPGLKFYPGKLKKVTTYAIGPSLMLGYIGMQNYYWEPDLDHAFHLGILINNYVNFQVSKHFGFGINAGFGLRYLDIEITKDGIGNKYKNTYFLSSGAGQATFNLSYRF